MKQSVEVTHSVKQHCVVLGMIMLSFLLLAEPLWSFAQSSVQTRRQKIVAASVYYLIQFTTWPQPPTEKLTVCSMSTEEEADLLMQALKNKKLASLPIYVRALANVDQSQAAQCDVCYFSHPDSSRAAVESLIEHLAYRPVLIIGTSPDFARDGGMIEVGEIENRLSFKVNLQALNKSGLKLSSEFLQLAEILDGSD